MCLVDIERPRSCRSVGPPGGEAWSSGRSRLGQERPHGVLGAAAHQSSVDCPISTRRASASSDFTFQEGRPRHAYSPTTRSASIPVRGISGPTCCTSRTAVILCTRCVRFMEDVAKEPVLNVSERGDRAYIGNPCRRAPRSLVGGQRRRSCVPSAPSSPRISCTSARWELDKAASICTGCSQGCNVTLDTRGERGGAPCARVELEVNR